ncbi:MAG: hypothetical protein ACSW8J_08665, partial [bacterium]
GRVNNSALDVGGAVQVSAANIASHTLTADASATGKGTGIGAAIGVSVVSDEAVARLNQGVNAAEVNITTETESILSSTATASASGGKKEGDAKSADKQSDGLVGTASKLAGKNKSNSISTDKINKASSANRQKAETSEGSVGVAGAIAVNVQNSVSRSEIMSGVNVKAEGGLSVTALNGTTAKVKANASTTNSDVGVGVGVAVNIIELQNVAQLGDGEIEAAMLKVAANTKLTEPEVKEAEKTDEKTDEEKKAENKQTLVDEIGQKVTEFMMDLIAEMGLDEYVSADTIASIAGDVAKDATAQIIKTTGLEDLVGNRTFGEVFDDAKAAINDVKDQLTGLPGELMAPIKEAIGEVIDLGDELASMTKDELNTLVETLQRAVPDAAIDTENLTESVRDAMLSLITKEFANELQAQITSLPGNVLSGVKDGLVNYLKNNASGILSGMLTGSAEGELSKIVEQAEKEVMSAVKSELKGIISNVLEKALESAARIELPGLTKGNADTVVNAFNHLKDAANLKKLENIYNNAVKKVTETFEKNVLPYKEKLTALAKIDFKTKIADGLRAGAKKALVTLSNSALDAMSDHFDLALEAAAPKTTGHVVDTQAIAGAGAKDVGVAGSVAVTVLNAETR